MIYRTVTLAPYEGATLTAICVSNTPELKQPPRRAVVVCPGGGYNMLSDREAEPIATQFLAAGFATFILRYTVGDGAANFAPLCQVALAIRHVREHAAEYNVDPDYVFTCGFSAGGHLTAMWGAENHGARHFGIPNPRALLLAYPLIGLENLSGPAAQMLCSGLLGIHSGEEKTAEYTASRQVDSGYPPVYLVQAEDDNTVPKQDAADMEMALVKAGIPHRIERVPSGGHGFGLGTATAANGWISRALDFVEENRYAK